MQIWCQNARKGIVLLLEDVVLQFESKDDNWRLHGTAESKKRVSRWMKDRIKPEIAQNAWSYIEKNVVLRLEPKSAANRPVSVRKFAKREKIRMLSEIAPN